MKGLENVRRLYAETPVNNLRQRVEGFQRNRPAGMNPLNRERLVHKHFGNLSNSKLESYAEGIRSATGSGGLVKRGHDYFNQQHFQIIKGRHGLYRDLAWWMTYVDPKMIDFVPRKISRNRAPTYKDYFFNDAGKRVTMPKLYSTFAEQRAAYTIQNAFRNFKALPEHKRNVRRVVAPSGSRTTYHRLGTSSVVAPHQFRLQHFRETGERLPLPNNHELSRKINEVWRSGRYARKTPYRPLKPSGSPN